MYSGALGQLQIFLKEDALASAGSHIDQPERHLVQLVHFNETQFFLQLILHAGQIVLHALLGNLAQGAFHAANKNRHG